MKYPQGRKVFLLGLVFFMTLGTFSCKQPKNKGKKTGQDHKVSWEVDGNGAAGYEVVAKVGNKEIKKGSLHSIGTVVSFEVKNIPTTHKLIDTGWNVSNGILNVDTADSTKATLTLGLGNKNVNVVITLTIPKHKVSWEVSPDGLAKYEVEAKVGDRKIEKDGSYPEGTVISFEVKDISDSYEIKQDGWASSSGELAVNLEDATKATLTLGKADAYVTIALIVVKHRVSWEVIPNGATGYEVVAKVNDNVITNDSLQDEGGKISFEVVNIPTTHKIRIDGWKTSSGKLACNLDDSTKATLILGKMDAHVTITLIVPKYTISWNVAPNGLTGYEVKAKVGDREIEKNSTYPEGTVVSFEVKDIPTTHDLMPTGWASSSGTLQINSDNSRKAILTLEKKNAHVNITLTIPKHKVSWKVVPNGMIGYEVEAKAWDKEIKKGSSHSEGTVVSFEVKNIPATHELRVDGWKTSSGKLAVNSSDFTKAILTLGKTDAHVTITLTVVKHRVSWEVIPNGATGCEVEAKVGDAKIEIDSMQDERGEVSIEVKNIPTTHELRIDGWKTSSGKLAVNSSDFTKAILTLGNVDAHVTITLRKMLPKHKVSWEVDADEATGYEVVARVDGARIENDSQQEEGTVVGFEVKNIPSTHELMPAGWASSSEILTINFSDYKKATLTLEKEDVTVTITLKKTGTTYNIGDEGAGGGRVFYVSQEGFRVYDGKGDDVVYHYLEMSKDTLGISKWFPEYSPMYTQDGLGYGKSNTYKILNARTSNELTDENCAVCRVSKYSTASTKVGEWWLPSKEELDLIYQNQKERVLASSTKRWHWSSSEVDGHDAWARDFGDGSWYKHYKIGSSDFSVRAVRAF